MTEMAGPSAAIALVVAVAENGVIGRGGELPWRQSSDLKLFRRLTMGKPIIMGRKTYESIGKPLDGRTNIVVTRRPDFAPEGVVVAATPVEAVSFARTAAQGSGADEIMVIGGAEIYRALLDVADRIYLTRIQAAPYGDTRFPDLAPGEWQEISREPLAKGKNDDHAAVLLTMERTQK